MRLGHDVVSFSFRRENMNTTFRPSWHNVDLGVMPNQRFASRIGLLIFAIPKVLRHLRTVRRSDVVIARNFDLLALAWIVRLATVHRRPRLVYECLDIHSLFTRNDKIGQTMRFLERRLLASTDLLWVSSPGFVDSYFKPLQGYRGRHVLIENKLWFDGPAPKRPKHRERRAPSRPLVLGWVGSIRCSASLALLAETARSLGKEVQVAIHGNIHRHAVPDFDDVIADHTNMTYHGAYAYPDGLRDIYLQCDAVWAQDLWQRGGNSDWLLPNRIYEASWFGCPSIAVSDTETGRRIAQSGLGFVVQAPTGKALSAMLTDLTCDDLENASHRLLKMPDRNFRLLDSDVKQALLPVLDQRQETELAHGVRESRI